MEIQPLTIEELSKKVRYEHLLVDGMYMRVMHCAKDVVLEGATHLKAGLAILVKGKLIIRETLYEEPKDIVIEAPCFFIVPEGSKKYGIMLEDTTFATVERTDNTELDKIEKELYAEDLITNQLLNYNKSIMTLGGKQ